MKKIKNRQRPRRKYRFDIVGHKKALKIWWDSTFKIIVCYVWTQFCFQHKFLAWCKKCYQTSGKMLLNKNEKWKKLKYIFQDKKILCFWLDFSKR
jgi:hypothetical protein